MIKVKAIYTGVCGSDINHIKNADINLPVKYMGHEIVGRVDDTSGTGISKGEWVVVNPFICNKCKKPNKCTDESYLHCPNCKSLGKHQKGGFSGEIEVPEENLILIPETITYKPVLTLIDPAAVIFHSILYLDHIPRRLLIIGSGTLACLSAIILRNMYPSIDIDIKIKNAERLYNFKFLEKNKINIITNQNDLKSDFYDIVYEAVGGNQAETLKLAVQCVKVNGQIIVLGAFSSRVNTEFNLNIVFFKQIKIQGVNSYCRKFDEFRKAAEWVMNNAMDLRGLITTVEHNISVEQLVHNIKSNAYRGYTKVVVFYD